MGKSTLLQHVEQFLTAHGGKAIAADRQVVTVETDVDVVPVGEGAPHVIECAAV